MALSEDSSDKSIQSYSKFKLTRYLLYLAIEKSGLICFFLRYTNCLGLVLVVKDWFSCIVVLYQDRIEPCHKFKTKSVINRQFVKFWTRDCFWILNHCPTWIYATQEAIHFFKHCSTLGFLLYYGYIIQT